MSIYQSTLNHDSEAYQKNAKAMLAQIKQLQLLKAEVLLGGGLDKQKKHTAKGRLLVRDRIAQLLDNGSDFLEISPFTAHQVYPENCASAGIICGIGKISGQYCVLIGNDTTVKGGSYFPLTVKKHLRAQEIAERCQLPCIHLVDSGGANLPYQAEIFADRDHFGRIFFNQARMSAQGINQIAIVFGPCTAGGAYIPAMSDETIIVRGHGSIYLAGPPLVKAATGEITDRETLGGADLHCKTSGLCDYACDSDGEAITLARKLVAQLNRPEYSTPHLEDFIDLLPKYSSEQLLGIIPADRRQSYNVLEVMACLVDNSDFEEFKPLFGKTLVCAFANLHNKPVGIIANNGILFSDSALKATHFIQLCCQRNISLIFLQNISGFMVGQQAEASGIAKHGAKMVAAVACAQVPKITLIIGGSFGAGNYAMCGRAYDPDFLFCWPNARVSVMGAEQATTVLAQVKNIPEDDLKKIQQKIEHEGEVIYGSARLWDDGIIDPRHSRQVISQCLDICAQRSTRTTKFGIWRM